MAKDIMKVMQKRDPLCGTIAGMEAVFRFGFEPARMQHHAVIME
jgi:hypothetical protein